MPKVLYHFTARELLPAIMREGLRLGDVPTGMFSGENAVWLTTLPNPSGHGLGSARELTDEDREFHRQWRGVLLPKGARYADKRAVRITIGELPEPRRLVRWSRWGRQRVASHVYGALVRADGSKHGSWFLYWGVIPPDRFAAVEFRNGEGQYSPNEDALAQHGLRPADAA
jgi:hypothetical protein